MTGEWINTKDRLPDMHAKVLGVIKEDNEYYYGIIERDYYTLSEDSLTYEHYKDGWAWYGNIIRIPPFMVLAWLPIPEYKEGEQE